MSISVHRCLTRLYGSDRRNTTDLMPTTREERMCGSKVRHVDQGHAESRAAFLEFMHGTPLRTYQCPVCKGWHLTKQEQVKCKIESLC